MLFHDPWQSGMTGMGKSRGAAGVCTRPRSSRCSSHGAGSAGCGENNWKRANVIKKIKGKKKYHHPHTTTNFSSISEGLTCGRCTPPCLGSGAGQEQRWGLREKGGPPFCSRGPWGRAGGDRRMCHPPSPPQKPSAGLGTYWDFFFFLGGKTSLCWLGMGNEWGGTLHP